MTRPNRQPLSASLALAVSFREIKGFTDEASE
jgi:hypothetical protein